MTGADTRTSIRPVLIISTCDGPAEDVDRTCRALLERKAISGANIVRNCDTLYLENDTIEVAKETIILMRSHEALVPTIQEVLLNLGHDDIEISVVAATQENRNYLEWIMTATATT